MLEILNFVSLVEFLIIFYEIEMHHGLHFTLFKRVFCVALCTKALVDFWAIVVPCAL